MKDPAMRERMMKVHGSVKARRGGQGALRRENVFARPIAADVDSNDDAVVNMASPPHFPKSEKAARFINESLGDNFVFSSLTEEERRVLVRSMRSESVHLGAKVFEQGEVGDFFYVIERGRTNFEVDGNVVGYGEAGSSFGELALLYDCPRAATALAVTACDLWKVDQNTFRRVMASSQAKKRRDVQSILSKIPFFHDVEDSAASQIADALTAASFSGGEWIVVKGVIGEVFYAITSGRVRVHDIGMGESQYQDQILGPGDWFGERSLLTGDPHTVNVTAESGGCSALCLSRADFERTLGPLRGVIERSMKRKILASVPIFSESHFTPLEMSELVDVAENRTFPKGAVLAEEGDYARPAIYVIRSGWIVIASDDGMIRNLGSGDYFGANVIKQEDEILSRQTIKVVEEATCGVLTKAAIEGVIGSVSRLGSSPPPPQGQA